MLSAPIITVLLATVLSTVHTDPGTNAFDMKDEEFVSKMNDIRRQLAKKISIPNMHELTWSQEHVDNIQKYFGKAGEFHFLPSYKYIVENCTIHLYSFSQGYATEHNMIALQTDYAAQMLAPLYHTIGCGYVLASDGPYSGCAVSPPTNMVNMFKVPGVPGSHCAAGYVNNDGLCSLAPTTVGESTTEGTTTHSENSPDSESTPGSTTVTVTIGATSEEPSTTVDVQTSEATSEEPVTSPGTTLDSDQTLTSEASTEPTKKSEIESSTTQTAPKTTPEPEPITSEPSTAEPIPETAPGKSTTMTPEGSSTEVPVPEKQRFIGDYDYFHGDWEEFNSAISNNLSLVFSISALLVLNVYF
ncbi:hypothetical protein CAEBREN_19936 [Caenorhabditis brenneri]|uniref:SCP domain-containing protein n=1 Tax=Caenorhabditis brenneri TaxID=135651 RepID=G0MDR1_CAEBE|nr:hypothetical protein CAEBREN_19936 [Caenorhabditis brenneri]